MPTFIKDYAGSQNFLVYGDASISNAQFKFNSNGSVLFDGTGDYLTTGNTSAMAFNSSEDFTIEAWIYLNNRTNLRLIVDAWFSSGWQLYINSLGRVSFYSNSIELSGTATALSLNAWHHVAAVRTSGTLKTYLDGVVDYSAANTASFPVMGTISIGAQVNSRNSAYDFNGRIEEIRITKGLARYTTSSFSVPTATFPTNIAGDSDWDKVVLLMKSEIVTPYVAIAEYPLVYASSSTSISSPICLNPHTTSIQGTGTISGTVKITGAPEIPTRSRVLLIREYDRLCVAETWSATGTGVYSFNNIDTRYTYTVLSYDHTHTYNAVVADNQVAT